MYSKDPKMLFISFRTFTVEMLNLVRSPVFILLTILGNALITIFSLCFFLLEKGVNPKIVDFIDALWWGVATATTTGYGDITPITAQGKVLGMLLMLTGMAIFGMFTGLFAETILVSAKKHQK